MKPFARIAFGLRALRARWQLPRGGPDRVQAVRGALHAAAWGSLSAEERRHTERIETLREKLLADKTALTVMDYGAGSSTADRSEEDMARGRPKELTVAEACTASKPRRWALLLFHLVRRLRPRVCVELGTCLGVSAAYQATALELNGTGRLVTLEGAAPLANVARENLATLDLERVAVVTGRFQDTLEAVLREHGPVDFIFIDGHHDEQATLAYFAQVRPHLSPGAVLVFDDINWSPGMRRAWSEIAASPDVARAVSLGVVGLCITPPTPQG